MRWLAAWSGIFEPVTKAKLIEQNKDQKEQIKVLQQELASKDYLLAQMQKMLFGSKSERFVNQETVANQMGLFDDPSMAQAMEEEEKQTIAAHQRSKSKKPKGQPKRIPLPEDLPRVEIILEPDQDTSGMKRIGEEVTEILDIEPPKFQVIRLIRPKYARPEAKTEEVDQPIVIAPMPSRVIHRGIPSTRLLAYLIISKFIDHLPYYRQIEIFRRIGVDIKSNTINGWISKTCVLLKPLYDKFCKYHFSQNYLQGDETRIKVLKVKKGKAHTGYYWVYYDPINNQVVFIFDPGRGRVYPAEHLKNFSGKLQTDGLSVYEAFDRLDRVELLACMTHVRRKFVDALSNDKQRAQKVLGIIQQLYELERQARSQNFTADQRLELRQQKGAPIMDTLKAYLDQLYQSKEVLPKSAIGKAVTYALGRWKYLQRYLEDGQVEIDNNLVENAIRPVAISRKNYLFSGSEQGARWGAIFYTLLGSAIRQGHDPLEYLTDILRRLPDMKMSQLHQLFPANWTKEPGSNAILI